MKYRPDIDGLRAVAVLSVILFHFFGDQFSGGYIGVDIFFVISGFLITSIIWSDVSQEKFSIWAFYERRVRRIGPALAVVVTFTLVMGVVLFVPSNFRSLSQGVVATVLSASNVLFWYQSGYFGDATRLNPLVHTWSLGVEEQFYIIFPAMLASIARIRIMSVPKAIFFIALLSFAFGEWATIYKPTAAFFLAPMRAWELLTGALLSLNVLPRISDRTAQNVISLMGAGLIAYGLLRFSPATEFPGFNALIPCMGAALIIYAGGSGVSGVNRLLSSRPMVTVGLLSYSLYLWHWPLISFARYISVIEPTVLWRLFILVVAIALSAITWRFVERPFRGKGAILSRGELYACFAGTAAILAAAGVAGYASHGWPQRLPNEIVHIAAFKSSRNPRGEDCLARSRDFAQSHLSCRFGADRQPTTVVLGDSHADALMPGLAEVATRYDASVVEHALFLCPPVAGIEITNRPGEPCKNFNTATLNALVNTPDIKAVVLAARWSLYIGGIAQARAVAEETVISTAENVREAREEAFIKGMSESIEILRAAGKSVFVVYPIPEMKVDVPAALAQLRLYGLSPDIIATSAEEYGQRNRFIASLFDRLERDGKIIAIHPEKRLCDERLCPAAINWVPLYADTDHLSLPGAEQISPAFEKLFERIVQASQTPIH